MRDSKFEDTGCNSAPKAFLISRIKYVNRGGGDKDEDHA